MIGSLLPTNTLCYLYDNALSVLFETCMVPAGITIPQILKYGSSNGVGLNAGPRYFTYVATIVSGNLTYLQYQHQPSYYAATGKN